MKSSTRRKTKAEHKYWWPSQVKKRERLKVGYSRSQWDRKCWYDKYAS